MDQLKSVHTLNARGNIFLEVARDYFSLDSSQMHSQIASMRDGLEAILQKKGLDYSALKGALTPDPHRKEIAFIFDTYELRDESWYGLHIFKKLMPLIEKKSSHSFLMGDFIGSNSQQDKLFENFCEFFIPARDFTWRHSGLLYIVYINNLTGTMILNIHKGLAQYLPYSGFVDCTYFSYFKQHIALTICNVFVKHKNIVIQGDPDYDGGEDNYNTSGYPFEDFGYKIRSVDDISFGTLLSYKIEIPIYKGFEVDEEMSLNYLSLSPIALKEFDVSVDDAKVNYLRSEKSGSLQRAGLSNISSSDLARLIKSKISDNYIYSMKINEYSAKIFNVIIEVSNNQGIKTRLLCGLKYDDEKRRLSLVTMF